MATTKATIIDAVAEATGFPRNKSDEITETLLGIIKETLAGGEDLLISGFGKFCVKSKGERVGRNPATEESMILPGRKVVTFRCSNKLRNKVNSP